MISPCPNQEWTKKDWYPNLGLAGIPKSKAHNPQVPILILKFSFLTQKSQTPLPKTTDFHYFPLQKGIFIVNQNLSTKKGSLEIERLRAIRLGEDHDFVGRNGLLD